MMKGDSGYDDEPQLKHRVREEYNKSSEES